MAEDSRHWGLGTQRGSGLGRGWTGRGDSTNCHPLPTCHYHLPRKRSAPAIQKVLHEFGKRLSATCLSTHVLRLALGGQGNLQETASHVGGLKKSSACRKLRTDEEACGKLFIEVKNWIQTKFPTRQDQLSKLWHIHSTTLQSFK